MIRQAGVGGLSACPDRLSGTDATIAEVVPAALVLRRLFGAIRYAARDEGFRAIFGAAISLIVLGTVTYSVSQGWNVVDSFYFAVCTLTTSNISDPHLTLVSRS